MFILAYVYRVRHLPGYLRSVAGGFCHLRVMKSMGYSACQKHKHLSDTENSHQT